MRFSTDPIHSRMNYRISPNPKMPGMVLALLSLCAVIISVSGCATKYPRVYPPQQPSAVFDQARTIIEENCIDTTGNGVTLDVSKRPEVGSLLTQLGPSVEWLSWKRIVEINNPFRAGTGIVVNVKDNEVRIEATIEDSPARRAGIKRDERIIKIDNESVNGLSSMMVIAGLQGAPGSAVVVTIAGAGGETRDLKITRSVLDAEPLVAEQFIEKNIGYLRIGSFNGRTPGEVKSAVKHLLREELRGLVIDLRDNDSDACSSATDTVQLFLDRGTRIGQLSGRTPERDLIFASGGWTHYLDLPLAVLINEATASGAEMFAAALRDQKRALLIGEKTAGNGEVRSAFQLKDGSFLIMRTHYIRTASGEPIEDRGILPHATIELSASEKEAVFQRIHSHMLWEQGDFSIDRQLTAAVSALRDQIMSDKPGVR